MYRRQIDEVAQALSSFISGFPSPHAQDHFLPARTRSLRKGSQPACESLTPVRQGPTRQSRDRTRLARVGNGYCKSRACGGPMGAWMMGISMFSSSQSGVCSIEIVYPVCCCSGMKSGLRTFEHMNYRSYCNAKNCRNLKSSYRMSGSD